MTEPGVFGKVKLASNREVERPYAEPAGGSRTKPSEHGKPGGRWHWAAVLAADLVYPR